MVSITDALRAVVISFLAAWERFWDNRFSGDDDIEYLRTVIEQQRIEQRQIIKLLTARNDDIKEEDPSVQDLKPLGGHVSWRKQAAQLEADSRAERVRQDRIKEESDSISSSINIEIAELEKELNIPG